MIGTLVALAFTGCGGGSDDQDELPPGAWARVGSTLITTKQLPAAAGDRESRRFALQTLIAAEWLEQEAKKQRLEVSLSGTDLSVARTQAVELLDRLVAQAAGPPPSPQETAQYYRENPKLYRAPEVRTLRRLPTDTRARSLAARRALDGGMSWEAAIARYAQQTTHLPPSTRTFGVGAGELPPNLSEPIFAAKRGVLFGPLHSKNVGWYLMQLDAVRKLPGRSYAEVRSLISMTLEQRRATDVHDRLIRRLVTRYRSETLCGERLLVPECRNGQQPEPAKLVLTSLT